MWWMALYYEWSRETSKVKGKSTINREELLFNHLQMRLSGKKPQLMPAEGQCCMYREALEASGRVASLRGQHGVWMNVLILIIPFGPKLF